MAWMRVLADGLTGLRLVLSVMLAVGGLTFYPHGVEAAAALVLVAWTTDALDGPLARRSGRGESRLGRSDLLIDVFFALCLLFFMRSAALMPPVVAWVYVLVWAIVFWRFGQVTKPLGAAFQGPVYAWFVVRLLADRVLVGRILLLWVLANVALTWRRLVLSDVPDFFRGMRQVMLTLRSRPSGGDRP